jgi:hypothetical protein
METKSAHTPPELVFPPQVPFAWTLRGARADRLRAESAESTNSNRIANFARKVKEFGRGIAQHPAQGATRPVLSQ